MSDFEGPYFSRGFIIVERHLFLFAVSLWEQVISTSCQCVSLPGYKVSVVKSFFLSGKEGEIKKKKKKAG